MFHHLGQERIVARTPLAAASAAHKDSRADLQRAVGKCHDQLTATVDAGHEGRPTRYDRKAVGQALDGLEQAVSLRGIKHVSVST
jgi:hypothetical protein